MEENYGFGGGRTSFDIMKLDCFVVAGCVDEVVRECDAVQYLRVTLLVGCPCLNISKMSCPLFYQRVRRDEIIDRLLGSLWEGRVLWSRHSEL